MEQITSQSKNNAQKWVNFLNELLQYDKDAVSALVNNRVTCDVALANHPTVQVRDQNGIYLVGLLGILNGFMGVNDMGDGPIRAVYEHDDTFCKSISKFELGENFKFTD